jgi:predicted restriction endonuclease
MVERVAGQRVGQEVFRAALVNFWQGRCAVTDLDATRLLRASHIKPWAQCLTDDERLDVFNGFLLAPHLDALFDCGWITFSDAGRAIVSTQVTSEQLGVLGLSKDLKIVGLRDAHLPYLKYHREQVFAAGS